MAQRWWHFLLAGLALAFVHAPIGAAILLFPVLVFVLPGGASAATPRFAAWLGWLFGVGYFGVALSWIVEPMLVDPLQTGWLAPIAVIGMAGGMALFWAAAFWLGHRLGGAVKLLVIAFAWCALEAARAFVLSGFPWADFAQATMDTPLSFALPWLGPRGVGLIVLALAAGLCVLEQKQKWFGLSGAALLGLLMQILPGPGPVPVALDAPIIRVVQPNAPQDQKWDPQYIPEFHRRLLAATRAGGVPDLIVWPEMSLTWPLNDATEFLMPISDAARGAPVILGGPRVDGKKYFNTMMVLGAGARELALYDKTHLVPFGEYMPLQGLMSKLGIYGFASGGQGYSPGYGHPVFDVRGIGLIRPLICYEGIFAEEVRQSDARPRLMVLITNDAWFGNWIGPHQHLRQARMRALELGVPMARSANTGISAIIDAHGVVTASLPMGAYGQVDEKLPANLPPTPYARLGEALFAILMAVLAALLLVLRLRSGALTSAD